MAYSSPEGIILGKGSTLQSLDLSINKEKVLSIKQQDKEMYSEEDMIEYSKYPGTLSPKEWFRQYKKK